METYKRSDSPRPHHRRIVQENQSSSSGSCRAPLQRRPSSSCASSAAHFDVAVDLRPDSPTFAQSSRPMTGDEDIPGAPASGLLDQPRSSIHVDREWLLKSGVMWNEPAQ